MKKLRYAVIGIKGIGDLHCRFAQQNKNVDLVGLVDIDEDFVRKKSGELGVQGFTDYRKMLDSSKVDAVSIATPHYLHAIIGMDCLNSGVHIFVEKPIAICMSEADKMIKLAKNKNLKICVGHQYRVYRLSRTMKHLIETEDAFCANILFDNGAFASIQGTYNQPSGYSVRQIAGDKGIILMQDVKSLNFDHKNKISVGKYEDTLTSIVSKPNGIEHQPDTTWKSVKLLGDPPAWKKLIERIGLLKIKRPHGLSILMDSFYRCDPYRRRTYR